MLEEANGGPAFVFIQDYHLALLPRMLKQRNPNLAVAQFWHIPWPNRETFRAFPWKAELLDGLLGNDLLGFHLRYHCSNFLDTVDRNVEALVATEHGQVTKGGHSTFVRPFPISIDYAQHVRTAAGPNVAAAVRKWTAELGGAPDLLGIGIDRVDYTKGIPERLQALDRLFEDHPEYIGRLRFVQVGVPSRTAIGDYEALNRDLEQRVLQLNRKWGRRSWQPVVLVHRHVDTSLDDGAAPDGRFLPRQLAARRHEPGGQGVRRQPDETAMASCCSAPSPGPPGNWATPSSSIPSRWRKWPAPSIRR